MKLYLIYPRTHRTGVTAVDDNPSDPTGAINAQKYHRCRFYITITGVDFSSLTAGLIFWDKVTGSWQSGAETIDLPEGNSVLIVDGNGRLGVMFLKVTAFVGTSFSFSADYVLN